METDDLDAILRGFDQHNTAQTDETAESRPPSPLSCSGIASQLFSYNLIDHQTPGGQRVHGIRSLRSRLSLAADLVPGDRWRVKLSGWGYYDSVYGARGRGTYGGELVDTYEDGAELGESYLQVQLPADFGLVFGRQIVVWGKADMFRINDIWNPDNRLEPGMDDGHSRLSVLMTRLTCNTSAWRLAAIISHEHRHQLEPVLGHDFYPYDFPAPGYGDSGSSFVDNGYGLALTGSHAGFDMGFYGASLLRDFDGFGLVAETPERRSTRIGMIGAAAVTTRDQWLFKAEAALLDGLEYYSLPEEEKTRFDLLLGTEYTGFSDWRMSFELVNRHLFAYRDAQAERDDTPEKDAFVWALRLSRGFLRDKLQLVFLSYNGGVGFHQGSAQKFTLSYALTDSLELSAGLLLFTSGDNYLTRHIGDNDSLFMRCEFRF